MGEEGGASGRAQLSRNLAAVRGDAAQQLGRGRRGDGDDPVGALDRPGAHVDRRRHDRVGGEHVEREAHAGDVRDGVEGPDLVVVDVGDGDAVRLRLRLGDRVVDGARVGADALVDREAADQLGDVSGRGMRVVMVVAVLVPLAVMVVMVPVLVVVLVALLGPVHVDVHVGAADAVARPALRLDADPLEAEGVHPLEEQRALPLVHQVVEGRHQHVAGSTHRALEVEGPHHSRPFVRHP